MNSLLKRLLAAALALPVLSAVTSSAAAAGEKTLATDKTVYEVGEDIFVTATGEGKDWVGIYARGETPGSPASIFWYYVDGDAEPGDAVNRASRKASMSFAVSFASSSSWGDPPAEKQGAISSSAVS